MEGILLHLKKRHLDSKMWENRQGSYYMWGYYDYLMVYKAGELLDYEPIVTNAQKDEELEGKEKQKFHEEYVLKLIKPSSPTDGFCYDLWRENKESKRGAISGEESDPCISIAMLHMSAATIKQVCETARKTSCPHEQVLNKLVTEDLLCICAELGEKVENLKCALYFTTGFGDVVLVFRTSRYDIVSDVVFALRGRVLETEANTEVKADKDRSLLSTSYLMCGIKNCCDTAKVASDLSKIDRLEFSIRFLLKSGITPTKFINRLMTYEKNISHTNLSESIESYQMYGHSDVMFLSRAHASKLLDVFVTELGPLNPSSIFYRDNISSTRTSMRCKIKGLQNYEIGSGVDSDIPPTGKTEGDIYDEPSGRSDEHNYDSTNYRTVIDRYYKSRGDALLLCEAIIIEDSPRPKRGLVHMLSLYRDLTFHSHSQDLKRMLKMALDSFAANLATVDWLLGKLNSCYKKLESNDPENVRKLKEIISDINTIIIKTDESILDFRHSFNELLLDMLRADRQFLEARGMIHPAVGSASKLLLAYSKILSDISILQRDTRTFHDASVCGLFVTSGGSDLTHAKRYFSDTKAVLLNGKLYKHDLIQIVLPERTLFRVGAALFHMLHELFHYVGYRGREERYKQFVESVSSHLSFIVSRKYFAFQKEQIDVLAFGWPENKTLEKGALYESIQKLRWEAIEKYNSVARENISKRLFCKQLSETDLLYDAIEKSVISEVKKEFDPRFNPEAETREEYCKRLPVIINSIFMETNYKMSMEVGDWRLSHDLPPHEAYLQAQFHKVYETTLTERFHRFFDSIAGNAMDMDTDEIINNGQTELPNEMYFLTHNINNAVKSILNAYSEAVIDVSVCDILGCNAWQYLSVFLIENEIPVTQAIDPLVPAVVLRYGAVLEVIDQQISKCLELVNDEQFQTELKGLLADIQTKIEDDGLWSTSKYAAGYTKRHSKHLTAHMKHIENLLIHYREYRKADIAPPLVQYVQHCRNTQAILREEQMRKPQNQTIKETLTDLKDLFLKGLSASAGKEMKMPPEIWQTLLKHWMEGYNHE